MLSCHASMSMHARTCHHAFKHGAASMQACSTLGIYVNICIATPCMPSCMQSQSCIACIKASERMQTCMRKSMQAVTKTRRMQRTLQPKASQSFIFLPAEAPIHFSFMPLPTSCTQTKFLSVHIASFFHLIRKKAKLVLCSPRLQIVVKIFCLFVPGPFRDQFLPALICHIILVFNFQSTTVWDIKSCLKELTSLR